MGKINKKLCRYRTTRFVSRNYKSSLKVNGICAIR